MDEDLDQMTREALIYQIRKLRQGIESLARHGGMSRRYSTNRRAREKSRKSNVSKDFPMANGKVELQPGPVGAFLSSHRRPGAHLRTAHIREDCRASTVLPTNRRQNVRR